MVSLEKWILLTPLQKLTKNGEDWDKLIVTKGFKKLPKVQNIAQSGHTAYITQIQLWKQSTNGKTLTSEFGPTEFYDNDFLLKCDLHLKTDTYWRIKYVSNWAQIIGKNWNSPNG